MNDEPSNLRYLPSLGATVLYNPDVVGCISVSAVLDADLWPINDGPPPRYVRTIAVVETSEQAQEILNWIHTGLHRPALVVGWNLPEDSVTKLLKERVPVLDGSMVERPDEAIEAILGLWPSEKFVENATMSSHLAEIEKEIGII